ncbi:unnamed protein product [Gongylonema pulchrum]|uniref:LXG domain-containing protein n=1 Tax=Gongylonema pulchrum TaxID=637853 RepID=A0A183DTM7_9BILA|nr:unnamed protein product [Gongylonema pulchrum]
MSQTISVLSDTFQLAKDAADSYQTLKQVKQAHDCLQMIKDGYQQIKSGSQVREGLGTAVTGVRKLCGLGKKFFS